MSETQVKRERLSPEALMERIGQALPQIAEHFVRDRDWIWYVGPSLQGEPVFRQIMKALSFRFAEKGHTISSPMSETIRVGSWGCSCLRPTKNKRRGGYKSKPRSNDSNDSNDSTNPLDDLAALGL
jgi:hypothetical protein